MSPVPPQPVFSNLQPPFLNFLALRALSQLHQWLAPPRIRNQRSSHSCVKLQVEFRIWKSEFSTSMSNSKLRCQIQFWMSISYFVLSNCYVVLPICHVTLSTCCVVFLLDVSSHLLVLLPCRFVMSSYLLVVSSCLFVVLSFLLAMSCFLLSRVFSYIDIKMSSRLLLRSSCSIFHVVLSEVW